MKRKEREWMYNRHDHDRKLWDEFIKGVDEFVTFSQQHPELNDREKIRCPCVRCKHLKYLDVPNVKVHLYKKGFTPNYYEWLCHGERASRGSTSSPTQPNHYREMVIDAFGNNVHQSFLEEATSAREESNAEPKISHKAKEVMEKYVLNLSESQTSGSEKDTNNVFFETVGGFRKGEVVGFGKDGASLYYSRSSRRPIRSAYPPSVSAHLAQIVERLEASEHAIQELEEREQRAWAESVERMRREAEAVQKQTEYIVEMKMMMDAFMKQFSGSSPFPRRPPDDPTDGASGAFVA